jgi:homoserine O-acetyltransferase/O-succinyltransferase
MTSKSLGLVKTQYYALNGLNLENGEELNPVILAYETYGELNHKKDNAILVCHALSGDAHAAGIHEDDERLGWWDILIGPGKALDTNKYFVICSNVIGGCQGSTGPSSINPRTKKPYNLDFPMITIQDMVNAQKRLISHLGIGKLLAVVGGSMGGMQVLQWSFSYPEMVKLAIPIATAAQSSPQQIAFNEVARKAIMLDPEWNNGEYSKQPMGLSLARMIGHITYLSDASMYRKFGRRLQDKQDYSYDFNVEFQVESYLNYKGRVFTERFDANSYIYISKAIDYFDIKKGDCKILNVENKDEKPKFLILAVTSDWLYPPYQLEAIVKYLISQDLEVQYDEIESNHGHDAFLLEEEQLNEYISDFISKNY